MKSKNTLPDWLMLWLWRALLGEIYPNIRAIAASFSEDKELRVRFYLDRPPIEFDYESLADIVGLVLSNASSNEDIRSVKEECEYSTITQGELNALGGLVYARREYEI